MKRRKFLQLSAASSASLMLNKTPLSAFTPMGLLNFDCNTINDRCIVLIQLAGGNDGLNTVIPWDQYDDYMAVRPTIGLPNSGAHSIIQLDSTLPNYKQVGLHPIMTGLKSLYDDGMLNVVQGVGYPQANRSHFKSTDIWLRGEDGTVGQSGNDTGWLARFIENQYNQNNFLDPLGIQLGNHKPSVGFHTQAQHASSINLSGQNLSGYYTFISQIGAASISNVPNSDYGDNLNAIMQVETDINTYAARITNVFNNGNNSGANYPNTHLANQLKTIARLLDGGSKTKVFLTRFSGFDTHNAQVQTGSPYIGKHTNLLQQLSEGIKAFQTDLENLGLADRVLTTTFSEFGRKATENGNAGTDHGEIAPLFVVGKHANAGVTGLNVNLSNLSNGQMQDVQHDYRQVFATMLQDWMGVSTNTLSNIGFSGLSKLPLIDGLHVVAPPCYGELALPVTLTRFEAQKTHDNKVELEWETSAEINHDYFIVETSTDREEYTQIAKLPAKGVNSEGANYGCLHESPEIGVNYYRLKQVDYDGQHEYSSIRQLYFHSSEVKNKAVPYPNPSADYFTLDGLNANPNDEIFVTDIQGKRVPFDILIFTPQRLRVDLSSLKMGHYYLYVNQQVYTLIRQ